MSDYSDEEFDDYSDEGFSDDNTGAGGMAEDSAEAPPSTSVPVGSPQATAESDMGEDDEFDDQYAAEGADADFALDLFSSQGDNTAATSPPTTAAVVAPSDSHGASVGTQNASPAPAAQDPTDVQEEAEAMGGSSESADDAVAPASEPSQQLGTSNDHAVVVTDLSNTQPVDTVVPEDSPLARTAPASVSSDTNRAGDDTSRGSMDDEPAQAWRDDPGVSIGESESEAARTRNYEAEVLRTTSRGWGAQLSAHPHPNLHMEFTVKRTVRRVLKGAVRVRTVVVVVHRAHHQPLSNVCGLNANRGTCV